MPIPPPSRDTSVTLDDNVSETTTTAVSAAAPVSGVLDSGRDRKSSRWHYIYFVLAALDIAAITAIFCFSWATISSFTNDAVANHQWEMRQGHYARLSNLVSMISEHGGTVFSSDNVEREQTRFDAVLEQFRNEFQITQTDARVQMSGNDALAVAERLDEIETYSEEAVGSAHQLFEQMRKGNRDEAVGHLVQLNRACTLITAQITEMHRFVHRVQAARHDQQLVHTATMRSRQIWLGVWCLLMVSLVAWYGHKLTRTVTDSVEAAREQAEELADERARMQTVFDAAAEGIITINDQGVIESCNQATLDLYRCGETEVVGRLIGSLMDEVDDRNGEHRSLHILDINQLIGNKRELMATRPDGTQFFVECAVAEVRFADHRIITGILHDITQRKEFESELREARVAAESATEAKSQFLANMSHEIRTPMTAIIGYSDLLLEPAQTSEERMRCVETVRRNADHLLTLINDILDLSKIEAGKMTVEAIECSPCQTVSDVASLMRVRAVEKDIEFGVTYDGPVPERITSDPVRIRQILINLAGNSIKFTKQGSVRIHVWTEGLETDAPTLHFKVVDTGIGMTSEQINRLFRPFTQADYSTTRKFGGTGLGLTICKRLAEILGGEISVTSVPGLGSSFEFYVPTGPLDGIGMVESPTESTQPDGSSDGPAGTPTQVAANVLLAEDGSDNRRLISHHLRKAGATVTTAENGRIAHDKALAAVAQGTPFDLVFMDMQMPVMDGYQSTSALREAGYTAPIVALTAHAMSGDRDKCLSAGCTDYATKPVEPRMLTKMICRYVPQPDVPAVNEAVDATKTALPEREVSSTPDENTPADRTASDFVEPLVSDFADDADMLEIIELFIDGLPEHVDTLMDALARSDSETLYRVAHQLKGSAGGYGYDTVSQHSLVVEQLAKAGGSKAELQPVVDSLVTLCHRVIAGRPAGNAANGVETTPATSGIPVSESTAVSGEVASETETETVDLNLDSRMDRLLSQIECLTESDPDWNELTNTLECLARVVRDSLQNSDAHELTTLQALAE